MSTYLSLARLVATESTLCLAGPFVHPDRPGSFVPATLPGALPLSSYVNISTIEPLCTPPPLQVTRVFLLPHDATCQEERSVRLAPPIRPTVGCATLLSRTLKEWCGLAARGAVCVSVCSAAVAPPSDHCRQPKHRPLGSALLEAAIWLRAQPGLQTKPLSLVVGMSSGHSHLIAGARFYRPRYVQGNISSSMMAVAVSTL